MTRAALLLAALLLAALTVAATHRDYIDWQSYAMTQLEGYRAERDRADAAETALRDARNEAEAWRSAHAEISSLYGEAVAENDRLRQYERYAGDLRAAEDARRYIIDMGPHIAALQAQVAGLEAEKATLTASLTQIHAAAAWLASDCPADGDGCRAFYVGCSKSMRPALDCDDIPLGTAHPASVKVGDVVIYAAPNGSCVFPANPDMATSFIIHRIVGAGYVLRGDANPGPDPCAVPFEAIVARIDHVVHGAFPENLE